MTTQFIFFSGKGGVGKTSMACATAVHYADKGYNTLIVTTDPASNLADVFEQEIGHRIAPINGVTGLWAMEIDPDRATEEYRERALAPLREVFPPQMVAIMEEQLDSPCTEEMASFDKFTDFMDSEEFDIMIFDTAPTGHTIRLLELPVEWSQYIEESAKGSGQTCMGPVATIQASKAKYDRAIGLMQDPKRTKFIFVVQPEATPIAETLRASHELAQIGIETQRLIVNGIIPPEECETHFFRKRAEMQKRYLAEIEKKLPLPAQKMYLLEGEIKGVERLRHVATLLYEGVELTRGALPETKEVAVGWRGPASLLEEVIPRLLPVKGRERSLFFAGKGGVGKTSLACVTAVWLARQGYRTLLLTTDPASHLAEVFEEPVGDEMVAIGGVSNLWAAKIDPERAAREYKESILAEAHQKYSPQMVAQMIEELESPCTEEMAVFDKFISYAATADHDVIVFDTAPTGHTMRLLELPIKWSEQIALKASLATTVNLADTVAEERFNKVIELMRDREHSTFVFVVYPESTPVLEAQRAMEELKKVGIETGLVVANFVLPPEECTNDYFKKRRAMQDRYLADMDARFDAPILVMPLLAGEIKGLTTLIEAGRRLFDQR